MPELSHHDLSELWSVVATFEVDGTPTEPGVVSATLRKPSGLLVGYAAGSPNIVAGGTGVYTISDVGAETGVHYLEVVGTSPAAGRERFSFVVDPRWPADLLEDYALTSIEEMELILDRVGTQGSRGQEEDDKRWIATLINTFSRLVANYTEREFLPVTDDDEDDVARVFVYDGDELLSLAPYEAREVSSVVLYSDQPQAFQIALTQGYTVTGYSWWGDPRQLSAEGTLLALELPRRRRGHRHGAQVTVTGKWGAGSVPADVKHVCEAEVADAWWASRARAPLANSFGQGAESYLVNEQLAFNAQIVALNHRSQAILDPHCNRTLIV